MRQVRREFNELILTAADKKKKGGSLAAVLKLIQDLAEFEEKIEECVAAQEMTENKQKVESFLKDIDSMYQVLLSMAEGSIHSLRSDRARGVDGVDGVDGEADEVVEVVEEVEEEQAPDSGRTFIEEEVRERGREALSDKPLSQVKKPLAPSI